MEKSLQHLIHYRLNIEILGIVEERLSARLASGAPVNPRTLAAEIINDALDRGFSWHELLEMIELGAEELDIPIVQPLRRTSIEH